MEILKSLKRIDMLPDPYCAILLLCLAIATMGYLALQIYGAYICFKKKWYMGAVSLFVPGFALVIGAFKFFFKKDLLK